MTLHSYVQTNRYLSLISKLPKKVTIILIHLTFTITIRIVYTNYRLTEGGRAKNAR